MTKKEIEKALELITRLLGTCQITNNEEIHNQAYQLFTELKQLTLIKNGRPKNIS